MNQQKIGQFLKELRKQKQLTQAQFAEILGVSDRTVSRWETGSNMPDFDVLIEIADFYGVEIREILEGERTETVNTNEKENLLLIADYTNQEKKNLTRLMRIFFLSGLAALGLYMVLDNEFISAFLLGAVAGTLLLGVFFTTKHMAKVRAFKLRLLNNIKAKGEGEK